MPFKLREPKTPEELIQEGEDFVKDLFGKRSNIYFSSQPYQPPPGSRAPSGLHVLTTATSASAAQAGKSFSLLLGFYGKDKAHRKQFKPRPLP